MRSFASAKPFSRGGLAVVAALALLVASGCSSGPSSNGAGQASADGSSAHLDVGCMLDHVDKPTEPFHYSYKYSDSSVSVDHEADVTPQAMDIVFKDQSGSHSLHAVRSDENSWNNALLGLSSLSFTGMTGRLAGIEGTSVIVPKGAENLNGYAVTKYAIDSAGASSSDQNTFETLFGPGSFEKGTIWMGQDGCAVKVILDEGLSQTNGAVEKRHFEIARVKK
ncbi:MAG: hypothetical protein ACRD4V_10195 [Candidatus Acidiferrales bacterium]